MACKPALVAVNVVTQGPNLVISVHLPMVFSGRDLPPLIQSTDV